MMFVCAPRLLLDWVCGGLAREVTNLRDDLCSASAEPSPAPSASLKCIRCDALYLRTAIVPEPNPPSGGSHQAPEWFCPPCCAPPLATLTAVEDNLATVVVSNSDSTNVAAATDETAIRGNISNDSHSTNSSSTNSSSSSSRAKPGRWGDALGAPEGFERRGLPLLPEGSDERLASDAIAILAKPLHGVKSQDQQHQLEEEKTRRPRDGSEGGATVHEWLTVLNALAAAAAGSARCRQHTADVEEVMKWCNDCVY